jgi:hypothetical protein
LRVVFSVFAVHNIPLSFFVHEEPIVHKFGSKCNNRSPYRLSSSKGGRYRLKVYTCPKNRGTVQKKNNKIIFQHFICHHPLYQ